MNKNNRMSKAWVERLAAQRRQRDLVSDWLAQASAQTDDQAVNVKGGHVGLALKGIRRVRRLLTLAEQQLRLEVGQ